MLPMIRKIALFSTKAIVVVPTPRTNQISTSSRQTIVRICSLSRNFATERQKSGTEKPNRSIEEILSSIDTTLTSEQQEHVDKLKKQIRGGPNAPRSLYRDVAKPDELVGEGNFFPRLADNAESLIDYALSFIPRKDGYRGSRRKKRMASKLEIKRENASRRVRQCRESTVRKQALKKKDTELAKSYRQQALEMKTANNFRTPTTFRATTPSPTTAASAMEQ